MTEEERIRWEAELEQMRATVNKMAAETEKTREETMLVFWQRMMLPFGTAAAVVGATAAATATLTKLFF